MNLKIKRRAQHARGFRRSARGVRFSLDRKNVLPAAAVVFAAVLFFVLDAFLIWEEEPTGRLPIYGWYTVQYWGLALLTGAVCLLEVDLPEKVRRGVGWVLMLLLPMDAFFAVDLINSTRFLKFPPTKLLANYLCYLMVFALLYALTRRVWVTALTGGLLFLVFGIANYFVVQFRGQPILPWDLQSLPTAMSVSGRYEYVPTRQMALCALLFFFTVALCGKLGPREKKAVSRTFRVTERAAASLLSVTLLVLLFPLNILSSMGITVWTWNQKTSSEITGVTAGFFANVQFLMVEKPAGYSAGQVKKLNRTWKAAPEPEALGAPGKAPTVVVVMSESLTDLEAVGDVTFSPDPQPFLHSLQGAENVIWGTAHSSVYGGNTCNSEYEFLTGNTTAFLPTGSKPYQQYIDAPQTALPGILKSHGYTCTAIHPGTRSAWQRDEAYPYLGFDKFISAKEFDVKRERVHGLTGDASHFDQIIREYERRQEGVPQFLFTVTIQNHGGYEDETVSTTVRVEGAEGEFPQAEQYESLLQISDRELERLVGYFARQEDPVLLVYFGDHWPNLEAEFVKKLLGGTGDSADIAAAMRKYEVPFLFWANYPLAGQKLEDVSLNYLSGLLLRAAGLQGTAYTRFLEDLRQTFPVITAAGSMDKNGLCYRNGEETPYDGRLREYAILQYNNEFGGSGKVMAAFTR